MNAELRALKTLKTMYKLGLYKGDCDMNTVNDISGLTGANNRLVYLYYKRKDFYDKILKDPSLTIENFINN